MAGKDVYLEKPMTLGLREALDLRQVVRSNPDNIFQVGTQKIMMPKYMEARKVIAEGGIGKPLWSQTSYCRNTTDGEWNYYPIDPAWQPGVNLNWDEWCGPAGKRPWNPYVYARWRRYKDFSTGIVGDLLVHEITPLVLALDSVGWPIKVSAIGGHYIDRDMENHDQVNLTVQFEGGHTMIVAGSTNNEYGLETMIRGQKANIFLTSRHCDVRPERPYAEEIEPHVVECPDIGNDQDQLRMDWLRCIRERAKPASDVELGAKVMVIVDLATRAMWTGHAQEFDPDRMLARRV
jgi:predicted dehydrogenase